MNKFLLSLLQEQIGKIIFGLLSVLVGTLWSLGEMLLPLHKFASIDTPIWLKLVLTLLLCNLALIAYVVALSLKSKNKFFLKFGIYWNKKFHPYCPTCETPIQYSGYASYRCMSCKEHIVLCNDNGDLIPIKVVERFLRGEHVDQKEIDKIIRDNKLPTRKIITGSPNR